MVFKHKPRQCVEWLVFLCLIGIASGEIYFKKGFPHVKLSNGALLNGKIDYSREGRPHNSFLGVPFGTIPGRFEEAHLAPAWDGLFNATKHGEMCPQSFNMAGQTLILGGEDCLNLNVHVPMNNTQKKGGYPVLVHVHGGAFSMGAGFWHSQKYFMDEDIIFVTFNYRLGAFGFLSTGDSAIQGNYGLKDAVLALKWVKENIANFGGDPAKVTINGMSAGGAAVHYLYLSPMTEGFFQKAIAQSGTALAPWAHNPNPKDNAVKLATHLKCPTEAKNPAEISSSEISTCLKGVSTSELNEAQLKFVSRWPPKYAIQFDFVPVVEPKDSKSPFLTESPWRLASSSPVKEIPFITGVAEHEGVTVYSGTIIQDQELLDELDTKWEDIILGTTLLDRFFPPKEHKEVAKKIRQFYFGDKAISKETRTNLTNMFSDVMFGHAARRAAIETASKMKKDLTYLYQYAYFMSGASGADIFGFPMEEEEAKLVAHAADMAMLTSMENMSPDAYNSIQPDSPEEDFSKQYIKLWLSFILNGKADHTLSSFKEEWKPLSRKELERNGHINWYRVDATSRNMDEEGPMRERAEFWDKLYEDHFIPFLS